MDESSVLVVLTFYDISLYIRALSLLIALKKVKKEIKAYALGTKKFGPFAD